MHMCFKSCLVPKSLFSFLFGLLKMQVCLMRSLINYWIFQPLFLLILSLLKAHKKLINNMVLQFLFPIFINILRMQMLAENLDQCLILQSCIFNLLLFKCPCIRNIATCDCSCSSLFNKLNY
jgi:hypothetical protein